MIVASFLAPRFEKWPGTDYDVLLQLLDASCRRFGLRHMVITDSPRPIPSGGVALEHFQLDLPENLMMAILEGQRSFLQWAPEPVLFVGADCLIAKDPREVLFGDMTITIGPFADCEMNTGAIWCADGRTCVPVWQAALNEKPQAWGEDQTTLYAAVQTSGLNITKVRCEAHNWAPYTLTDDAGMPTVVHFRGKRKSFMADWAKRYMDLTV